MKKHPCHKPLIRGFIKWDFETVRELVLELGHGNEKEGQSILRDMLGLAPGTVEHWFRKKSVKVQQRIRLGLDYVAATIKFKPSKKGV